MATSVRSGSELSENYSCVKMRLSVSRYELYEVLSTDPTGTGCASERGLPTLT